MVTSVSRRSLLRSAVFIPGVAGFSLLESSCATTPAKVLKEITDIDLAVQAMLSDLSVIPGVAPYVPAISAYLDLVSEFCQLLTNMLAQSPNLDALQRASQVITLAARLVAPAIPVQKAQEEIGAIAAAVSVLLLSLDLALPTNSPAGPSAGQPSAAQVKVVVRIRGHVSNRERAEAMRLNLHFAGYRLRLQKH